MSRVGIEPTTLGLKGGHSGLGEVGKRSQPPAISSTGAASAEPRRARLAGFEQPLGPTWVQASRSAPALRRVQGGAGRLLSAREVAERLGVSTRTVYELCARGELVHVRILNAIRVAPVDLEAFTAQRGSGQS